MQRTNFGIFLSATVAWDIHLSTVPSMVGLALMVTLPLGAGQFGHVLLVLRMDGQWMMIM